MWVSPLYILYGKLLSACSTAPVMISKSILLMDSALSSAGSDAHHHSCGAHTVCCTYIIWSDRWFTNMTWRALVVLYASGLFLAGPQQRGEPQKRKCPRLTDWVIKLNHWVSAGVSLLGVALLKWTGANSFFYIIGGAFTGRVANVASLLLDLPTSQTLLVTFFFPTKKHRATNLRTFWRNLCYFL